MLATPPRSENAHESSIDYSAKRTRGMYSSRDVTFIEFLTPYVKLAYFFCPSVYLSVLTRANDTSWSGTQLRCRETRIYVYKVVNV